MNPLCNKFKQIKTEIIHKMYDKKGLAKEDTGKSLPKIV